MRSPSAPANLRPPALPLFERQEPSQNSRDPRSSTTPDDSESDNLAVLREREKTRLAEKMLRHTEEEAERLLLMVNQEHRREKQETEQRAFRTLEELGAWTSSQVAASEERARNQEREAAETIGRTERDADDKCRRLRHQAEDIVRDLRHRMNTMETTAQSVSTR